MNRLAKLRLRSSSGAGLNASCQSLGNGAGYETANDESINSACSLYYSVTEEGYGDGNGTATNEPMGAQAEEQQQEVATGDLTKEDNSVDATLENDFSVEEVSTIRKPMLVVASPATVKMASKMSCKYLGVSSTPAKALLRSAGKNLSGIEKLNETDEKRMPSAMKKMREPKLSEGSSADDGEETKMTLESSVQSVVERGTPAAAGHKSFGTNVLAQFFESLDVNKASPVPQIKVSAPDEVEKVKTPEKQRDSNSLENFFESLKKNPEQEQKSGKENRPQSERKKGARKSLIPKTAEAERPKTRSSILGAENRVASPIVKLSRKSSTVRLIPERLKEMRKVNQSDLVSVKRKSVIPFPKPVVAQASKVSIQPKKAVPDGEDVVGDSIKVGPNRKSMLLGPKVGTAPTRPVATNAAVKRKSVVPAAVASRKSVLPVKNVRRSVVSAPPKIPLKVPAKTTIMSSESSRRISLGKRSITDSSIERTEPLAKQRKSLAPVKEAKTDSSPKDNKPRPASRIRPPSTAGSIASATFKKPETFGCDTCQRTFRLKSSLESHKKLAHQAATPSAGASSVESCKTPESKCRYCSKTFINGKILSNHLISNCQKIPIPDKRKLLAVDDDERAKFSPSRNANARLRPPSVSASGTTSLDTDTSTSSSIGDTSANSSSATTVARPPSSGTASGAIRKQVRSAVGHTGITRTPKKEMKCHLCGRKYLNAVEYALHVQAHAKGLETLGMGGVTATVGAPKAAIDKKGVNGPRLTMLGPQDASKLVQKLVELGKKA